MRITTSKVCILAVLICLLSINTNVFASTYENNAAANTVFMSSYQDGYEVCWFTWYSDIGMAARWWGLTTNVYYEYYQTGNQTSSYKLKVFAKADDPKTPDLWSINNVTVRDGTIAGTTCSLPNYETNVMVSPNWIWESKYGFPNISLYGGYTVTGTGVMWRSNDCIPVTSIVTTTLQVNP